jgi:heme-degrading monooxygenase HmoA
VRPLVVVADFRCTEGGDPVFRGHLDRTLAEVRAVAGCLGAELWERSGRRYRFFTLWTDAAAVKSWVGHPFHREVLMPGFRAWCCEGWFGELRLEADHSRARRCAGCGRWTRSASGWSQAEPARCRHCGAALESGDAPGETTR